MENRLKFRTAMYYQGKFKRFYYWSAEKHRDVCLEVCDVKLKPDEQCTGFYAKNENLIYAGDIIQDSKGHKSSVVFDEQFGMFKAGIAPIPLGIFLKSDHYEIIGHLHEKKGG